MKYFYFQMLKDKKIIIHKTDGKTFIPITGRSYRTNSSYGFRLPFQFLTLYAILAAILSSVKQGKIFPQNVVIQHLHFLPLSTALQVKTARRLQEESAACCPSHPVWLTSTVPNIELMWLYTN